MLTQVHRVISLLLPLAVPGVLGFFLVRAPARVQARILRFYERHPWQARFAALEFIASPGYIAYLRWFGIMLLALFVLLTVLLLVSLFYHPQPT